MELGEQSTAPSFDLTDEAATSLKQLGCKAGDTGTANWKMGDDGSYEINSIEKDEAEPAADDSEEKILGYKRPEGKKETPPLTSMLD